MSSSKRAVELAVGYLRSRVRSVGAARIYLLERGVSPPDAEQALRVCRERGLLDDRAGVRLWAEQWARRGYSWAAIQQRLAARGFADAAIQHAGRYVGRASEDDDARARVVVTSFLRGSGASSRDDAAQRTRHIRLHSALSPEQSRRTRQAARRLAARGFDPETIERVLKNDCEF